jgi:putative Mg2+ transporter-C (MgtC) family protein
MDFSIAFKLIIAALLGGLIGLEREIRDKPAGLRTNMLVCMGASQFMVISMKAAQMFGGDPMRIAAQIITGIGFLGAGAVLHSHGFVMGLTTAATIWVVAGVGMALGAGMYGTAVAASVIAVVTLSLFSMVERRLNRGRQGFQYHVTVKDIDAGLKAIQRSLQSQRAAAADLSFKRDGLHYRISFHTTALPDMNHELMRLMASEVAIVEVETNAHVD